MAKRSLNDLQRQYNSQVATGKKWAWGTDPAVPVCAGALTVSPRMSAIR